MPVKYCKPKQGLIFFFGTIGRNSKKKKTTTTAKQHSSATKKRTASAASHHRQHRLTAANGSMKMRQQHFPFFLFFFPPQLSWSTSNKRCNQKYQQIGKIMRKTETFFFVSFFCSFSSTLLLQIECNHWITVVWYYCVATVGCLLLTVWQMTVS